MNTRVLLLSATLLASLTACSGNVKESLGLTRKAPDEFRVVSRPPLSVPPDFSLRPPSDTSSVSGTDVSASKQAESLVMGEKESTTGLRQGNADTAVVGVNVSDAKSVTSKGSDAVFLQKAGATQADSAVRAKLRQETGENVDPSEKSFLDKLRDPTSSQPLVDAGKEKERIQGNKEEGKDVTEGETPTVKPRDRGVLGKIF